MKETRIKTLLNNNKGIVDEVLFHHRLSTSTEDVRNACHPFSTKNVFESNYVGVHNGMVDNDLVLQKQHRALGIGYVSMQPNGSFNDSEALIYDLARYFEGQVNKITASGTIAFIVVKRNEDGKPVTLFFGTNRASLVMKRTKNSLTVSSEGSVADGNTAVPNNVLHMYDYDTGVLRTAPMFIQTSSWAGGKSYGYSPSSTAKKSNIGGLNSGYVNSHASLNESWEASESKRYWNSLDGDYDFEDEDEDDFGHYPDEDLRRWGDQMMAQMSDEDKAELIEAGEFVMRTGTRSDMMRQLVTENGERYAAAAVAAEIEHQLAQAKADQINNSSTPSMTEEQVEKIIDTWLEVSTYAKLMKEIADMLDLKARNLAHAKEAAAKKALASGKQEGKAEFGFHTPATNQSEPVTRAIQKGGLPADQNRKVLSPSELTNTTFTVK